MVAAATGLTPPQPIAQHTVQKHLETGTVDELLEKVIAQGATITRSRRGDRRRGLGANRRLHLDVDIDRKLAVALDADVLLVAKDAGRGPEAVAAELAMHKQNLGNRGRWGHRQSRPALNETDIPAPHMPEMGSTTVPLTDKAAFVEALQAQGLRLGWLHS